jgi:hypothetical protein
MLRQSRLSTLRGPTLAGILAFAFTFALQCLFPGPCFPATSPPPLKPEEAVRHIGETATVCGVVASAKHADTTRGQGTFLHLDRPYPNQIFTVIIWEKYRPAFGEPEKSLLHKRICVTGAIQAYKGKPEILPQQASQVSVEPKQ